MTLPTAGGPESIRSPSGGKAPGPYETAGGWVAITKDILSEVLGAGKDVKLVGLSPMPAGVLRLMCPTLVVFPEDIAEEAPRE